MCALKIIYKKYFTKKNMVIQLFIYDQENFLKYDFNKILIILLTYCGVLSGSLTRFERAIEKDFSQRIYIS